MWEDTGSRQLISNQTAVWFIHIIEYAQFHGCFKMWRELQIEKNGQLLRSSNAHKCFSLQGGRWRITQISRALSLSDHKFWDQEALLDMESNISYHINSPPKNIFNPSIFILQMPYGMPGLFAKKICVTFIIEHRSRLNFTQTSHA